MVETKQKPPDGFPAHPAESNYRCMLYIMPPIPCGAAGMAGSFSFLSQMMHSVVRNIPATEAAFSRATRVTFAGSTIFLLFGTWAGPTTTATSV